MDQALLGEIKIFAGNFAPRGWTFCHGQILDIEMNSALFSILGTTYGGDGEGTFGLPDLRGRVPMHAGQGPGLSGYRLGQKGGVEEVTLDISSIPSHKHAITSTGGSNGSTTADLKVSDTVGNTSIPSAAKAIAGKISFSSKILSTAETTTVIKDCVIGIEGGGGTVPSETQSNGGSMPHSNMQPYLSVNYIIALEGIFPSRS